MSEELYHIVDCDTEEVIGELLVDDDEVLEAEAQAGALGYYLQVVE